jgi:hypothetical protein
MKKEKIFQNSTKTFFFERMTHFAGTAKTKEMQGVQALLCHEIFKKRKNSEKKSHYQ